MHRKDHAIEVFKGLQKPLVFHSFKGKFIYWGAGFAVMSLVNAIVLNFIGGYLLGGAGMLLTLFGGLYFTAQRQKRGLHNKTNSKGVYIIRRTK
jgi:hypothetical protein